MIRYVSNVGRLVGEDLGADAARESLRLCLWTTHGDGVGLWVCFSLTRIEHRNVAHLGFWQRVRCSERSNTCHCIATKRQDKGTPRLFLSGFLCQSLSYRQVTISQRMASSSGEVGDGGVRVFWRSWARYLWEARLVHVPSPLVSGPTQTRCPQRYRRISGREWKRMEEGRRGPTRAEEDRSFTVCPRATPRP
jgi:hypothetical protein